MPLFKIEREWSYSPRLSDCLKLKAISHGEAVIAEIEVRSHNFFGGPPLFSIDYFGVSRFPEKTVYFVQDVGIDRAAADRPESQTLQWQTVYAAVIEHLVVLLGTHSIIGTINHTLTPEVQALWEAHGFVVESTEPTHFGVGRAGNLGKYND